MSSDVHRPGVVEAEAVYVPNYGWLRYDERRGRLLEGLNPTGPWTPSPVPFSHRNGVTRVRFINNGPKRPPTFLEPL